MSSKEILDRFFKTPYGREINRCIQCGTCSASCPLSNRMDHAPRELFALIRDGETEDILRSDTPWYCVSCYKCTVRCPKEIPVTDIMYTLKQLIRRYGSVDKKAKAPDMYTAFSETLKATGKISESAVMQKYGLKHPVDLIKNVPIALKMARRGRLEIKAIRIIKPENVYRLLADNTGWEENR